MKPYNRTAIAFSIAAGFAGGAQAQVGGPQVSISGFGTLAMTATDTGDAEFARPNQQNGVGTTPRTGPDSNFGIQATYKFSDTVSATVQGLVRKNASDYFGAELPWAFVKVKANEDFSLRVGRTGMPVYMISDFRNVGYANTMIRPPAEVYRQVNGGSLDGADLTYQHSFGESTLTAQLGLGTAHNKLVNGARIEFSRAAALHVLWENGPLTLRFGRADATFSMKDNPAVDGLLASLVKAGFAQAAHDYSITDVKGSFTSVGAIYDPGNFIVQGEYAVRRTDTRVVMDTSSWYAMFGYRVGRFTPYYYHGNIKQDNARTYSGVPAVGPLKPAAAALDYLGKAAIQSANAIGLRWDFASSAALKVQVDRISPKDGPGAFVNATPTFTGPATVYAVGVDFVF